MQLLVNCQLLHSILTSTQFELNVVPENPTQGLYTLPEPENPLKKSKNPKILFTKKPQKSPKKI